MRNSTSAENKRTCDKLELYLSVLDGLREGGRMNGMSVGKMAGRI